MSEDCIFCKIAKGELQTKFVYQGERVVAFPSIESMASTHILIVPKEHIPTFLELKNNEVLGEMLQAAHQLINENKVANGYKVVFNGGGYQHVPHVHWHLLGGDDLESGVGN